MNLREQIVAEARGWIGTPFVHQGRVRKHGCDCLGLVIGVAKKVGLKINDKCAGEFDQKGYSMNPDGEALKARLDELLVTKSKDAIKAGDVFLMKFGGNPQHLGFFADYNNGPAISIIHCYSQTGKVVEHRLNDFWFSKIDRVYSITD